MNYLPRVAVLLAVYNGEKYLKEQLDSIFSQSGVFVKVFASVDLSKDHSLSVLLDYQDKQELEVLPYGERYGSAGANFFRLINDVETKDFDYVAFADQDDVWLSDKLRSGILELKDSRADALSSDVIAFWEGGERKLIKKSYAQTRYDHLFESPGPGCSFLLTQELVVNLKRFIQDVPQLIDLHDWFIYAYARSFGYNWVISNQAAVLYRQHDANQCGANNGFSGLRKRLKIMRSGWYHNQVLQLFEMFEPDNPLTKRIKRKNYFDSLCLSIKILHFRRRNKERLLLFAAILLRLF